MSEPEKIPYIDLRRICDMKPWGEDMLGGFVKVCVHNRQRICRDGKCFGLKRCKDFPAELSILKRYIDNDR